MRSSSIKNKWQYLFLILVSVFLTINILGIYLSHDVEFIAGTIDKLITFGSIFFLPYFLIIHKNSTKVLMSVLILFPFVFLMICGNIITLNYLSRDQYFMLMLFFLSLTVWMWVVSFKLRKAYLKESVQPYKLK